MPHVTLVGDRTGDYVVAEERPDGTMILEPETEAQAILRGVGSRPLTSAELDALMADVEPDLLPPDDEG